jgi:hypothetical protein
MRHWLKAKRTYVASGVSLVLLGQRGWWRVDGDSTLQRHPERDLRYSVRLVAPHVTFVTPDE